MHHAGFAKIETIANAGERFSDDIASTNELRTMKARHGLNAALWIGLRRADVVKEEAAKGLGGAPALQESTFPLRSFT